MQLISGKVTEVHMPKHECKNNFDKINTMKGSNNSKEWHICIHRSTKNCEPSGLKMNISFSLTSKALFNMGRVMN